MAGLLDSIALAAAEKIWRTAGPRAGMLAYRNLLSQDSDTTRAQAILRGIDCAMEAGDEQAAFSFAESWGFVRTGDLAEDVVVSAARLEARGFQRTCHLILVREHERKHDPRVGYALGRVCQRRGLPGDALAAFTSCIESKGAAKSIRDSEKLFAAASLEVARARAREPETAASATELVKSIDPALLVPRKKMQHARLLLASKSRFERAGALSALAEVARQTPALAAVAAQIAAAHADRMGHALTPLEADRVVAALASYTVPASVALARKRLESLRNDVGVVAALAEERRIMDDPELAPLVVKAKAVLAGGSGPDAAARADASAALLLTDLSLAAIAEHGRGALRVTRLREVLALAAGDVRPFPRSALTLAMLALGSDDRSLHPEAATLAARAIALGAASPRGLLPIAALLVARGEDLAADRALRLAAQRDEPGADDRLMDLLCHRGRRALASGDRVTALACLSEARGRHLSKQGAPQR